MTTRHRRRHRQRGNKARAQLGPWRMGKGPRTLIEVAGWWADTERQEAYRRWHFAKFSQLPPGKIGAMLSIFTEINPFFDMLTFKAVP